MLARAVTDASGSFTVPNPLRASGIPADGEPELADRIAYGLPDVRAQRDRYAGKRVLVAGSGHSAMNMLQELVTIKAEHPDTESLGRSAALERARCTEAVATTCPSDPCSATRPPAWSKPERPR